MTPFCSASLFKPVVSKTQYNCNCYNYSLQLVMLNPDFFEIKISVSVIRINSGYPVFLVLSYVMATHSSPPPTVRAGKLEHSQWLDTRRGTKWPFPLSAQSASNLVQFDLVSKCLHAIREALA